MNAYKDFLLYTAGFNEYRDRMLSVVIIYSPTDQAVKGPFYATLSSEINIISQHDFTIERAYTCLIKYIYHKHPISGLKGKFISY